MKQRRATSTQVSKKPQPETGHPHRSRVGDRGFNRAEELLAAALDLFASRNFADVTIKDIGSAVGANTALIYYYFDSKEDLFRATIEAAVERAFKHFRLLRERRTTPPEVIAGWLENHLELYDMICKLIRICIDYASTSKRVVAIDRSISRFYDEERAVLSTAIRAGIDQKLFQSGDPEQIAMFVSTYLDGVMVRSVISPDFKVERAITSLQQLLWQLLGYQPRRPRKRGSSVRQSRSSAPGAV